MLTDTDFFIKCGQKLYGKRWQCDLARDLGKSDRQVRRWVAGDPIPSEIFRAVAHLMRCRSFELEQMAAGIHMSRRGKK